MSLATMMTAPAAPGGPLSCEDRNEVIEALVNQLGWPSKRVGSIFGMSDRHARRIAQEVRATIGVAPASAESAENLTPVEARTMMRDYASDPYTNSEEREAAMGWMAVYAQASGVAELQQIKFRKGIRVPAKARVGQA